VAAGKTDLSLDGNTLVNNSSSIRVSWRLLFTLVLLAATLMASKLADSGKSASLAQPLDSIGASIAGFSGSGENLPLGPGALAALKCDAYLSRSYRKSGIEADLFIAYYAQQRSGESMHSPKHCLPGAGWEIWNYGSTDVEADGRSFKINKYSISHEDDRRLVLYWYQSKTRIIASEYLGKVLLARDALLRHSTAGSIVRIIVPDRPGALESAREFASGIIPQVHRCFAN
jgi:EpsI family protein